MVLRDKGLPRFSCVHTLPLTLSARGGDVELRALACSVDLEEIQKATEHM